MASINSSQSSEENKEAEKRFLSNDLDMLIISPERLLIKNLPICINVWLVRYL